MFESSRFVTKSYQAQAELRFYQVVNRISLPSVSREYHHKVLEHLT